MRYVTVRQRSCHRALVTATLTPVALHGASPAATTRTAAVRISTFTALHLHSSAPASCRALLSRPPLPSYAPDPATVVSRPALSRPAQACGRGALERWALPRWVACPTRHRQTNQRHQTTPSSPGCRAGDISPSSHALLHRVIGLPIPTDPAPLTVGRNLPLLHNFIASAVAARVRPTAKGSEARG